MQLFPDDEKTKPADPWADDAEKQEDPILYVPYTPQPEWETERQTGLAWSLGIAFFVSVVFCLFLGWIADLFLGSSPWGLVGGIILGAILGFLQFYRITSQIFQRKKDGPSVRPLMPRDDDEHKF